MCGAPLQFLTEVIGGIFILLGLFVVITAVPLIISMLVAMLTIHFQYGFSSVNTIGLTPEGPKFGPPGYEINLVYIAGLVSLMLTGGGGFSIDSLIKKIKLKRVLNRTLYITRRPFKSILFFLQL